MRAFDRDYLLYASEGAIRLGAGAREWLLPPAFAAWIPAGTPIAFDLPHPVVTCSVLFAPGFCAAVRPAPPDRPVVFAMSPLAREMVRHARRWGPDARDGPDGPDGDDARTFFRALAGVAAELAATPADVWRPASEDPSLARALRYTEDHMGRAVTLGEVAAYAGLSERTLLRRYTRAFGLTWAQSLRRARMIAATERLATTGDPVTAIAFDVGYASLSAFNAAFRRFAGTTPGAVRRRGAGLNPGP